MKISNSLAVLVGLCSFVNAIEHNSLLQSRATNGDSTVITMVSQITSLEIITHVSAITNLVTKTYVDPNGQTQTVTETGSETGTAPVDTATPSVDTGSTTSSATKVVKPPPITITLAPIIEFPTQTISLRTITTCAENKPSCTSVVTDTIKLTKTVTHVVSDVFTATCSTCNSEYVTAIVEYTTVCPISTVTATESVIVDTTITASETTTVEAPKPTPDKSTTSVHKVTTTSLKSSSSRSLAASTSSSIKKPEPQKSTTEKKPEAEPTPSESPSSSSKKQEPQKSTTEKKPEHKPTPSESPSSSSSATATTSSTKKHEPSKSPPQTSSQSSSKDEPTSSTKTSTTLKTYTTTHGPSSSPSHTSSSSSTTSTPKPHEPSKPQHPSSSSSSTPSVPIPVETSQPPPATSAALKPTLSTTDICNPTNNVIFPQRLPKTILTYTTWSTATPTPSSPKNHNEPHETKDNKLTATATIPFIPLITGIPLATANEQIKRDPLRQVAKVTIDGYVYQLKRGETAVIFVEDQTSAPPTATPTPAAAKKVVRGSSDLAVGRKKRGDRSLVLARRGRFSLF